MGNWLLAMAKRRGERKEREALPHVSASPWPRRPDELLRHWMRVDQEGWERGASASWRRAVQALAEETEAVLNKPLLLFPAEYRLWLENLLAAHRDLLALLSDARGDGRMERVSQFYRRWLALAPGNSLPRPTRILLAWLATKHVGDLEEWHRQREHWLSALERHPLEGWELGWGEEGWGEWLEGGEIRQRILRLEERWKGEVRPAWLEDLRVRAGLVSPSEGSRQLQEQMETAFRAQDWERLFTLGSTWLRLRCQIPAVLRQALEEWGEASYPFAPQARLYLLTIGQWLTSLWERLGRGRGSPEAEERELFEEAERLLARLQRQGFLPFPSTLEARLRAFPRFRPWRQARRALRRWNPMYPEERAAWLRACAHLAVAYGQSSWLRWAEAEAKRWWPLRPPPGVSLALTQGFSRCGEETRAVAWWKAFQDWLASRSVSLALEARWRAQAAEMELLPLDGEGWHQEFRAMVRSLRRRVRRVEPLGTPVPLEEEQALEECVRGVLALARRWRRLDWVYEALEWRWALTLPEMRLQVLHACGATWLALGEVREGLHCFDQAWETLTSRSPWSDALWQEWGESLLQGWEANPWHRHWERGQRETERWRRRLWERGVG